MEERFRWPFGSAVFDLPYSVFGDGSRPALLLPALSSVSSRDEMAPLATRIAARGLRCLVPDWPGFGDQPRAKVALEPATMQAFLDALLASPLLAGPLLGLAAGHGATHLLQAAGRQPGRFERLILVAPTWRGPLPTAMGAERRPLYRCIRQAIEAPVVGPLLYRANVSRPVVRKMLREHVYANPGFIDEGRLAAKMSVTRQPRARFGTAAFVTGALDPVDSREAFLALFAAAGLPPIILSRPQSAPAKSGAEMDAAAAIGGVEAVEVPGALATHEEHPDEVAAVIARFVDPAIG